MKKQLIFALLSFLACTLMAQSNKKYLKVSYLSRYDLKHDEPPKSSISYNHYKNGTVPLCEAYKYYYTLYVDLKTHRSVYRFDSLVIGQKPKGMEQVKCNNGDSLFYVIKYNDHTFFKYENFSREDYHTGGTLKEVEWTITDKTQTIYGLHCKKAVSKDKDFFMTAWFTTDIAVSTGPGIFLNLPGLVVRSEDFFWTTEIENIAYIDSEKLNFEKLIATYKKDFDENKKKNPIKEKKLLIQKAEFAKKVMELQKKRWSRK